METYLDYIHHNAMKVGLVHKPEHWRHCSAINNLGRGELLPISFFTGLLFGAGACLCRLAPCGSSKNELGREGEYRTKYCAKYSYSEMQFRTEFKLLDVNRTWLFEP